MCFNEGVDQGRKEGSKAEYEVVTLKILWEEKETPLQINITYKGGMSCYHSAIINDSFSVKK